MQTVTYDVQSHVLRVQLGEQSVAIEGLPDAIAFRRESQGQLEEQPLWLNREQADVLAKMIAYILDKVRISEPSRLALQAIEPAVRELLSQLVVPVPEPSAEDGRAPSGSPG